MKKRYIIAILVLIFLVFDAMVLYFIFSKREKGVEDEDTGEYYETEKIITKSSEKEEYSNGQTDENGEGNKDEDQEGKILDEQIKKAQLMNDEIYYKPIESNSINKISFNDKEYRKEILASDLPRFSEFKISPNGENVIYMDSEKGVFTVYNFETKNKVDLSENLSGVSWHKPSGDEAIIGSYSNPPHNNINLYRWKSNERIELLNLFVEIGQLNSISPDGQILTYFIEEPAESGPAAGEVVEQEGLVPIYNFVAYNLEEKKEIIKGDDILGGKLNSNGTKLLLYMKSGGQFSTLNILDLESEERKMIYLSTYFQKTLFANDPDVIFYAKVEGFDGAQTSDTIWKYDLATNRNKKLTKLDSDNPINVENLMTSSDDKRIYFINGYDKNLYVINTK